MNNCLAWMLAALLGLGGTSVAAADIALSGFGSLAYAKSNQPYNYGRFINNNGTVKKDSVAGVQIDAKLNDSLGATVQGKFAPSSWNDSVWDSTLSWAFLSWRPSNDWLIRLGRQRASFYLYSESMDVGTTYDFARLPVEMYGTAPTTDYIGGSFSKTWSPDFGELTLDGYSGRTKSSWRFYQRDSVLVPEAASIPGANFKTFNFESTGIVLTLLQDEDRYRASAHDASFTFDSGQTELTYATMITPDNIGLISPLLTPVAGFVGGTAYTVLPQALTGRLTAQALTLGAEIKLQKDFRLVGEYVRRKMTNADLGLDSGGGYLAILRDVGAWTPYVSYGTIKSNTAITNLYQAINTNPGMTARIPIPQLVDALTKINASQRVLADALVVYDQNTIAFGTSYRLSPKQKIKAEWARTHVGVTSGFVDAPAGGDVSNQNIDVLSFSYNVVF